MHDSDHHKPVKHEAAGHQGKQGVDPPAETRIAKTPGPGDQQPGQGGEQGLRRPPSPLGSEVQRQPQPEEGVGRADPNEVRPAEPGHCGVRGEQPHPRPREQGGSTNEPAAARAQRCAGAGEPADAVEVPRPVAGGNHRDQCRADAEHDGDDQVLQTPRGTVPGDRLGPERRDQGRQDDEREVGRQRAGGARDRDAEDCRSVLPRGKSDRMPGLVGEPDAWTARKSTEAITTL